jgi:predicted metal-dependent hydrolase
MTVPRDRDAIGRARNARPRDDFGRPMPYGAPGVERVPDDLKLTPPEAIAEAQRYLDEGHPFQAHEVLEASWKSAPVEERGLWRALAQICVGLTHAQRGNESGAVTLLSRGSAGLAPYARTTPYGIEVDRIATQSSAWAGDVAHVERLRLTAAKR